MSGISFTAIQAAVAQISDWTTDEYEICPAQVRRAIPMTECEDCIEHGAPRIDDFGSAVDYGQPGKVNLAKYETALYTWTNSSGMTHTECREHLRFDEFARLATTAEYSQMLADLQAEETQRNWRKQHAAYGIPAALSVALPDHVIVAAFRLPDRDGMMKGQCVVIARPLGKFNADDCGDNHCHTVWYMWQQDTDSTGSRTKWVRHQGSYDLSWNRALDEFKRRIDTNYGTRI